MYENSPNSSEKQEMIISLRDEKFSTWKVGFIDENSRTSTDNHDMRSPRGGKMGFRQKQPKLQ
jgi:hypothetical protein